jgi:hypothetical protein
MTPSLIPESCNHSAKIDEGGTTFFMSLCMAHVKPFSTSCHIKTENPYYEVCSGRFKRIFYMCMFVGEHPAAMQHGEHGASSKLVTRSWITMFALLALLTR